MMSIMTRDGVEYDLAMMSIMTRDGVDDESAMVLNKTL
jgi:hypothetical protein